MIIRIGPYDKDEIYDPRPQPRPEPDYRPNTRPDQSGNIPQRYKAAVGDGTKLSCEIGNYDKRTSWRRQDGQPLPSNSRLLGGDLVCLKKMLWTGLTRLTLYRKSMSTLLKRNCLPDF